MKTLVRKEHAMKCLILNLTKILAEIQKAAQQVERGRPNTQIKLLSIDLPNPLSRETLALPWLRSPDFLGRFDLILMPAELGMQAIRQIRSVSHTTMIGLFGKQTDRQWESVALQVGAKFAIPLTATDLGRALEEAMGGCLANVHREREEMVEICSPS